jgi:clan AA aspartic protease
MGVVTETFTLRNPLLRDSPGVEARALVDTGCFSLCIPESIYEQLGPETLEVVTVSLADGSIKFVRKVGPVVISFKERSGWCDALVMGDQVLVGVLPLETMNLMVVPKTQTLEYNPYQHCVHKPSASACKDR